MSPVFLNPAARTQMLAPAVIVVLCTILAIGASSLIVTWYPYSFSDTQWRFTAAAQLLSAVPQMAFLLTMLALSAVLTGYFTVLRWAAILSVVIGVLVVFPVVPLFALDFLTGRHMQRTDDIGRFTREGLRLGATAGALGLAMIWAGRRAWLASIRDLNEMTEQGYGLIVGQEESAK